MTIRGRGRVRIVEAAANSVRRQIEPRFYRSQSPLEIEPCVIIAKDGGEIGPPSTWTYQLRCLTTDGVYGNVGVADGLRLATTEYNFFPVDTLVPVNFFAFTPKIMVPESFNSNEVDQQVIVKITGNASGGGKYNGRILTGTSTATGSGDETQPEGMTVPGSDDALVLNLDEDTLPTHWLATGSYALGRIVGSTGGLSIVEIPHGSARIASPQVLGASSGAAETDNWARNAVTSGVNYGDKPVTIQFITREAYDTGTGEFNAYYRSATFAADGRMITVSAETKVEIFQAVAC